MTRNEARKDRKRRRKLLLAFIMILLLVATLGTATYAWFTANRVVTVESIDVNVSTSQGLQISVDAANWKSIVTREDILGAGWSGVANQIPNGEYTMSPVSTIGEVENTTGFIKMFKGTVNTGTVATGGNNYLTAVRSLEAGGATYKNQGDFVVFDLFFQSSETQTVYLTSASNVVETTTDSGKGIQNAARVAFVNQGYTDYGAPAATAQALKATSNSAVEMIWEPNYDVHTTAGIANALNVYGITVGASGASKQAYKGVKAEIPASVALPLNSTNSTYLADVTTVGSVAAGIPTSGYLEAFELHEGITKMRIYMWIEGQDVDCEDRASGSQLTYNLQFSIDERAS